MTTNNSVKVKPARCMDCKRRGQEKRTVTFVEIRWFVFILKTPTGSTALLCQRSFIAYYNVPHIPELSMDVMNLFE
jgi:hypothetical protein